MYSHTLQCLEQSREKLVRALLEAPDTVQTHVIQVNSSDERNRWRPLFEVLDIEEKRKKVLVFMMAR